MSTLKDTYISCPACSVFYRNKSFQNKENKTIVYKAIFIKSGDGKLYEVKCINKDDSRLLKTSMGD